MRINTKMLTLHVTEKTKKVKENSNTYNSIVNVILSLMSQDSNTRALQTFYRPKKVTC